jgi:hypothetical protein
MNRFRQSALLLPLLASFLFLTSKAGLEAKSANRDSVNQDSANHNDAVAAAAFEELVPVLRNPRCMNCHSSGDYPRQGDDMHRHTMEVRRGPDGHGLNAVKCSTCHQDHNLSGIHTPPGAPDWGLPPPSMPMIWEGLSDHHLCELLKDPQQNGHRSVAKIVEHMHTPLVLWAWDPGEGRKPIPSSENLFLSAVERWAAHGAACPLEKIK